MMTSARPWYGFTSNAAEGNASMVELLGGKGANLAEMCRLGLQVPPGITLPTTWCTHYLDTSGKLAKSLEVAIAEGLKSIEVAMDAGFGDPSSPLLLSVRSGAAVSMPGMMDTVLNIGLTRATAEGLAQKTGDRRFALDAYRRLIQMYGNVVLGIDHAEAVLPMNELKASRGLEHDHQLDVQDLETIINTTRALIDNSGMGHFPDDAHAQLLACVRAVFDSWQSTRAQAYRRMNGLSDVGGTAVNLQAMVFGNYRERSGTGVAFSRHPVTGFAKTMGEWLACAQGEDVVAGIRTPAPLEGDIEGEASFANALPEVFAEFLGVTQKLESHYRDMQDIEFTVQEGKLYLLQTRRAKRTALAAIKIAVDMVEEGLITKDEALLRVDAASLDQLLHARLDPAAEKDELARGLPASPGAATGKLVFTNAEAKALAEKKIPVILLRPETSPEDIEGMEAAEAVVTLTGGMTSHAAVVARGMGVPCVTGASSLRLLDGDGIVCEDGRRVRGGSIVTVDGQSGTLYLGDIPRIEAEFFDEFRTLMSWADQRRRLGVRANADTPLDAERAVSLGAQGIGLCRTEHMFFAEDRLLEMRRLILASGETERRAALEALEPHQRDDFAGIFFAMSGRPVTIRLLDPPLHEFLPHDQKSASELASSLGLGVDEIFERARALHEFNPMLGHRGVRLGLTAPEIYRMQVRAMMNAACDVRKQGQDVALEVMIPLVIEAKELLWARDLVQTEIDVVQRARGDVFAVHIGTMIETPRAALLAESIAEHADFFSFGTNDLTQTTAGLSRDDAHRFLGVYQERKIFERDPFAHLDEAGVGQLVKMATDAGRRRKSDLKVGICGEHGGDPRSVRFFHTCGLNYVSCSPFRLPIARLAAAQAAIAEGRETI